MSFWLLFQRVLWQGVQGVTFARLQQASFSFVAALQYGQTRAVHLQKIDEAHVKNNLCFGCGGPSTINDPPGCLASAFLKSAVNKVNRTVPNPPPVA